MPLKYLKEMVIKKEIVVMRSKEIKTMRRRTMKMRA
jgi:hypothetical protein